MAPDDGDGLDLVDAFGVVCAFVSFTLGFLLGGGVIESSGARLADGAEWAELLLEWDRLTMV